MYRVPNWNSDKSKVEMRAHLNKFVWISVLKYEEILARCVNYLE